jgi:dihydrofolate synthase/folylpolyglutamate synthase
VLFKISEQDQQAALIDLAGTFGQITNLKVGLAGDYQAENAATAFAALKALQYRNLQISESALWSGFAEVRWPGRMQTVSKHPLIILDGAHNDYSAYRLKKAVEELYPDYNRILVLGISANKDISGIVSNLLPGSRIAVLTKARHSRAASPEVIKREARKFNVPVIETADLNQALAQARELAQKDDLVLVTGSLFLVGEALEIMGKKA